MATRFEYCTANDDSNFNLVVGTWGAQSFTPQIAHKITSVRLKFWRAGTAGTITVSIRATDGDTNPTGEDLCSGTLDGSTITTSTPGILYEISLGDGYNLAADVIYAIVVRAPGTAPNNCAKWRFDETSPAYTRGIGHQSFDSGVTWARAAHVDFMFEEWGDAAPIVTTQAVSNIGGTAATGNGNITDLGDANPTAHGVCWGTSHNPTIAEDHTDEGAASEIGAFTSAITELTTGTLYYVRAYATNLAGTSYGDEVSFTTLIAPTVTTDEETAISQTMATLNGTLDDDGDEDCECGFEWGPDTNYGVTTPTETKAKSESFSQVIHGLQPGTTYHFRAFATNSAGTSYGADRSFTATPLFSRGYALSRQEL